MPPEIDQERATGFLARVAAAMSIACVMSISATAQQLPSCQEVPRLERAWGSAWRSLGIAPARDDRALGDVTADRYFGNGNWYPVDGTNQTMCGVLRDWTVYNGRLTTPHELDVHPYLTPSIDFGYLITDLPAASFTNTYLCDIGSGKKAPCVWGEVTMASSMGEWLFGRGFPRNLTKPYMRNNAACVFGPWVMERFHGWRSEIHPYRQFWAAQSPANAATVDLLLVQDSSERYGRETQFTQFGPRSGSVWSSRSVDETIGLAYELAENESATLTLTEQKTFGVTSGSGSTDIRHQFGGSSVDIHAPGWIKAVAAEACSTTRNGMNVIHGIDWLAIKVDPPSDAEPFESAATMVRLNRSGTAAPPVEPLRRMLPPAMLPQQITRSVRQSQEAELPPATSEPTLRLDIVSIEVSDDVVQDAHLDRTSREWQLTADDGRTWQVTPKATIRLRPYYTGTTQHAEDAAALLNKEMEEGRGPTITVAWRFSAMGWDNGPARLGVGPTPDRFLYGVRPSGGDRIRTRVARRFKRNPLLMSGADRWRAELAIESPSFVLLGDPPLSAVLQATATLQDSAGRVSSRPFQFNFYSHVPQIADVRAHRDPPATFLAFLGRWVAKERPDLQIDPMEIAAALASDSGETSAEGIHADSAHRRAQIVRLNYLISIRTDYLEANDLMEILRLARAWAEARWPRVSSR